MGAQQSAAGTAFDLRKLSPAVLRNAKPRRVILLTGLRLLSRLHGMEHGEISDAEFDLLVDEALEDVPAGVLEYADNVAFFVQDDPPPETPELLGIYDGVPLTERDSGAFSFVPPDTITLFKHPLIAYAEDREHLREEILVTIVHEIAHHYGIEEDRLHELGWG